jgi:methionyl-tRNA formyltransferase
MRIVLIGHPSLGVKLLEAMIQNREEVVAVFAPGDNPEQPGPLKILAEEQNLPVHQPDVMKEAGVLEIMASYKPELGVLAFVSDLVPLAALNCPNQGTIMYHPSLLPRHRGGSAINWTIIQGDSKTGLTIIWPDAGIDTGPILLQKEVAIFPDDTVGSLFFDKLYPLGIAALLEAIQLVKEGKAPRVPQDDRQATYEPLCREEHAIIDWHKPVQEVYNLIRGTNPQPGASTTWQGQKLKIYDSQLVGSTSGANPGEIISMTDSGFTVACRDGSILVSKIRLAGSSKIDASVFIREANLKEGMRLG